MSGEVGLASHIVIPAKAGIHEHKHFRKVRGRLSPWIPAFAGMTLNLQ
jgi:hypothetical protein